MEEWTPTSHHNDDNAVRIQQWTIQAVAILIVLLEAAVQCDAMHTEREVPEPEQRTPAIFREVHRPLAACWGQDTYTQTKGECVEHITHGTFQGVVIKTKERERCEA